MKSTDLLLNRSPLSNYGMNKPYQKLPSVNRCSMCQKHETQGRTFMACARCVYVGVKIWEPIFRIYCGKDCQRKHWEEHRIEHNLYEARNNSTVNGGVDIGAQAGKKNTATTQKEHCEPQVNAKNPVSKAQISAKKQIELKSQSQNANPHSGNDMKQDSKVQRNPGRENSSNNNRSGITSNLKDSDVSAAKSKSDEWHGAKLKATVDKDANFDCDIMTVTKAATKSLSKKKRTKANAAPGSKHNPVDQNAMDIVKKKLNHAVSGIFYPHKRNVADSVESCMVGVVHNFLDLPPPAAAIQEAKTQSSGSASTREPATFDFKGKLLPAVGDIKSNIVHQVDTVQDDFSFDSCDLTDCSYSDSSYDEVEDSIESLLAGTSGEFGLQPFDTASGEMQLKTRARNVLCKDTPLFHHPYAKPVDLHNCPDPQDPFSLYFNSESYVVHRTNRPDHVSYIGLLLSEKPNTVIMRRYIILKRAAYDGRDIELGVKRELLGVNEYDEMLVEDYLMRKIRVKQPAGVPYPPEHNDGSKIFRECLGADTKLTSSVFSSKMASEDTNSANDGCESNDTPPFSIIEAKERMKHHHAMHCIGGKPKHLNSGCATSNKKGVKSGKGGVSKLPLDGIFPFHIRKEKEYLFFIKRWEDYYY